MKTAIKIVGGLVALIVVAILVIPFIIDVDKYRPEIVKAANEQINGHLELGKLKLSLWGHVQVQIDGMKLNDAQSKSVVSVKDASFDIPYSSVLSGSPLITLHMVDPAINVLKGRDGKLNVMSLMKPSAPGTAAATTGTNAPAQGQKKMELPSMVANAHVGVLIENASVVYKDETMALSNTIDHLNIRVNDFSLNRKTEMEIWADLKTQMADLKLEGSIKLTAALTPEISGGEFKSATVNAMFTADDLAIQKGELFHKKKGDATNFSFDGKLDQQNLTLQKAVVKFHNAEVTVKGGYSQTAGANIDFSTLPIDLKSWSDLVPMLKEYELEGKLTLSGDVKGKPEAMQYNAKVGVQNLAAKGPNLKAKPLINAELVIATDRLEKIYADLKGPGNEIILNAKMVSFTKPQLTFDVKSPGMDLDQWIEFPKTETAAAAPKGEEKPAAAEKGAAPSKAAAADFDAMVEPLRKNEMMKGMAVDGSFNLAFIKAKGMRIDDLCGKIQFKNLVAGLTAFHMKMYDGTIGGSFTTDLKPHEPQYNMALNVNGLDIQKAVETNMQSFKNTLTGKLSTSLQGGGSSFNPEPAKRHLQLKGDFKVLNAQFKTIDVAKMVSEAIASSVNKMAAKVPMLAGKKIDVPPAGGSKYESISSNFTISGGMLDAPNFFAKAAPKAGIDIKGDTKMGLVDESLNAKWELIDTQKVSGADQVSVNIAGKNVNNILAKGEKDAVIIPVTVGCKWSNPCPNYTSTAEYLAGVAAGRLSHVAQDVVKDKIKEQVNDQVKQKAGDALKNAVGNGFKNLFGH